MHRGEGDDPSSRWKRRIEGETQRMWAAVESGGTECAALQLCCVLLCGRLSAHPRVVACRARYVRDSLRFSNVSACHPCICRVL